MKIKWNKQTKAEEEGDCGVCEWADEERSKHVTHSEPSRRRSRRRYLPACLHALTAAEEWEAGGEEVRQRRVSHCFSRRRGKKQQVSSRAKGWDGRRTAARCFWRKSLPETLHTLPDSLWESLTGGCLLFWNVFFCFWIFVLKRYFVFNSVLFHSPFLLFDFIILLIFNVLSICIYSWISLPENNTKSTATNTATPTINNNNDSHDTDGGKGRKTSDIKRVFS